MQLIFLHCLKQGMLNGTCCWSKLSKKRIWKNGNVAMLVLTKPWNGNAWLTNRKLLWYHGNMILHVMPWFRININPKNRKMLFMILNIMLRAMIADLMNTRCYWTKHSFLNWVSVYHPIFLCRNVSVCTQICNCTEIFLLHYMKSKKYFCITFTGFWKINILMQQEGEPYTEKHSVF